jgi:transcriptional regulator with XRE-family HTH domain
MNPESIYRHIGILVRDRRKKLKLTQETLAARLGISRASLANIETGRQKVLVHQLYGFAATLDLMPIELLPPVERLALDGDWRELPLPSDLKPQQREQVGRLIAGSPPEPKLDKKDLKHGK